MKTTARSILSASISFGLAASTAISAVMSGPASAATVLSFSLLAVYGLAEIMVLSYAEPRPRSLTRSTPRLLRAVASPVPCVSTVSSRTEHRTAA